MNFFRRLKKPVERRVPARSRRLPFVLGGASHNWSGPGRELCIDEVLRLHPPELMVPRTSVAPVLPGGVRSPAGQHVMLCLAAANRDPDCFADPAAIRLDRRPARHLSSGAGIHKYSGTAMSGAIVAAALEALLGAAPHLRAAEPLDRLSWSRTITMLTPRRLLVAR